MTELLSDSIKSIIKEFTEKGYCIKKEWVAEKGVCETYLFGCPRHNYMMSSVVTLTPISISVTGDYGNLSTHLNDGIVWFYKCMTADEVSYCASKFQIDAIFDLESTIASFRSFLSEFRDEDNDKRDYLGDEELQKLLEAPSRASSYEEFLNDVADTIEELDEDLPRGLRGLSTSDLAEFIDDTKKPSTQNKICLAILCMLREELVTKKEVTHGQR